MRCYVHDASDQYACSDKWMNGSPAKEKRISEDLGLPKAVQLTLIGYSELVGNLHIEVMRNNECRMNGCSLVVHLSQSVVVHLLVLQATDLKIQDEPIRILGNLIEAHFLTNGIPDQRWACLAWIYSIQYALFCCCS